MRLYNCDNIEFMKKLPDNEFDLAICDPPYGIGKDWKKRNKGAVFAETSYDNKRATKEYFDEIRRVAKHYIVFGYNYYTEFFGSTNYLIVWDKLSSDNQVFKYSKCELACTDIHVPCNIVHCEWDGYRMGRERGTKKIHPHQKPIELYEWLLFNYAKPGWKIFDPNMGSGSSLIAAHNLNYDYTGVEIDKTYFDAINKRYKNMNLKLDL